MACEHASREQLSPEKVGAYRGRRGKFGDHIVMFESIPAGFPPGGPAAFRGLPNDACPSPHWGYVFKGRVKFRYPDGREDVVGPGEAYYAEPGHQFECLEDAETVEFSLAEPFQRTLEVVGRNIGAASR